MAPPVPLDGLGTMDPARYQPRGPVMPPATAFNPPVRPPLTRVGYCPRGHPGAWEMGGYGAQSYCPVCGLPGDWIPSEECPHAETRPLKHGGSECLICVRRIR
jgi:hypothetical protein